MNVDVDDSYVVYKIKRMSSNTISYLIIYQCKAKNTLGEPWIYNGRIQISNFIKK